MIGNHKIMGLELVYFMICTVTSQNDWKSQDNGTGTGLFHDMYSNQPVARDVNRLLDVFPFVTVRGANCVGW